jgi:hypothetical protein
MVNNFTNINKTSNHLSPYITEHKKETTYDVGNSGPDLGQAQICGMAMHIFNHIVLKDHEKYLFP